MLKSSAIQPRKAVFIGSIIGLLAMLLACGGSGDGGTSVSVQTGSVALLLTDAPVDDFVRVLVTVTQIDLLPSDDDDDDGTQRETIFEGRETFDLLALENISEPFAIADDIPAGTYSKFRMDVEEIELVRMDGNGGTESIFARLPGGNRIDLNPQGQFRVEPGELLTVRLDIDARNSIHIIETGSGGFNFRPQVFIDVLRARDPGRLIFVEGIVREIDVAETHTRIWLCEISISHRSREGQNDKHCLSVFVDDDTSVFDESGESVDADAIDVGDRIGVLGGYATDDDERFAIDAKVIELGGSQAFLMLTGLLIEDADGASDALVLVLDPGQGFVEGSSVEVEISEETRIFTSSGEEIDPAELAAGTRVEIDGVLVLVSNGADAIRSAVIFVREVASPLPEPI